MSDVSKIRWVRLEKILEDLCGRFTSITLTTHELEFMSSAITWQKNLQGPGEGEESVSAVSFNDMEAEFLLDARRVKSIDMVIRALAHELTHVVLKDPSHDSEFNSKWKELRRTIKQRYYENIEDTDK